MRHLLAISLLSAVSVGTFSALWGWPGAAALIVLLPAALWSGGLVHLFEAFSGRVELRMGFVAMGLSLGIGAALLAFVVMSAAVAPERVQLERTRLLPSDPGVTWSGVEEPTYWMRWDALIGEIGVPEDGRGTLETGASREGLLNLAGLTVPVTIAPMEVVPGRVLRWGVTWTAGSPVEDFQFGVELEPRGAETLVRYRVDYRVPGLGARLANRLSLERGLGEAATTSLSGLEDWLQEQP